ncbi:hypothetical protein ALP32_04544 [Pseudomonas avellanae]|uniref:Uncharacterized protein n=1 Tax=Pseudomonas avellanae TaxID=46257 RepID=A0A3M5TN37_9PSED|nr:hypothetical protein ALP32_04544 [Pseudomonas avellanae]
MCPMRVRCAGLLICNSACVSTSASMKVISELREYCGENAGRQAVVFILELVERLTELGDLVRERRGGRFGFAVGLHVGIVEAPAMGVGVFVPQVAFGARQACRTLSTTPTARQTPGFDTDPRNGRPLKRIMPATLDREVFLAERCLGKLHAAFERLAVHPFRIDQIANLQDVVVLHPVAGLPVVLDQNAAGTRVAHIQHQVHLDRQINRVCAIGGKLDVRDDNACRFAAALLGNRLGHEAQQVEVVTNVALLDQLFFNVFAGTMPVAFAVDLRQPVLHPFLVQKPAALARVARQAKGRTGIDVVPGRCEVLHAGRRRHRARVECQCQAVGVAIDIRLFELDQTNPRPVGRAFVVTLWR